MCISDGYAMPACAIFTLTISGKNIKYDTSINQQK